MEPTRGRSILAPHPRPQRSVAISPPPPALKLVLTLNLVEVDSSMGYTVRKSAQNGRVAMRVAMTVYGYARVSTEGQTLRARRLS
jgi:hypothetical protein